MKRLVQLLMLTLVMVVSPVMAVDVAVVASNQGTANYWGSGDVVYNEMSWTGDTNWTFIGNNNDYATGYQSVLKFSLADFTSNALTASLSVFPYDCSPHANGVQYFQLQHITQATSGPIVRADVTGGGSVIASNQGTANYWGDGDVVYNETSWTGGPWSFVGCNNDIIAGYQSVLKFPLATLSTNASSATLSVFPYDCYPHATGVQYFQLQHITQATSGPVVRADVTVLTGENIGTPLDVYQSTPREQPMTWDVTNYVNADRANGFACSSFRFIAVDAQGNWLQTASTWAGLCSKDLAPGNLLFSPHITAVENIGEPLDVYQSTPRELPMLWDVTNYINADRANGFACSSFRFVSVDAQGNWLQTPNTWAGICTKTLVPGNLTFSPNITASLEPKDCNEVFLNDMGINADMNHDCHIDINDLQILCTNWLDCTTPGGAQCVFVEPEQTGTIARGTATIDGSLNEWSNQLEWVHLDNVIYGNTPSDITESKVALRWDEATDAIYGAVVVTDTNHVFRDDYIVNNQGDWNSSDRIEIYSQGSAVGGVFDAIISENAQQYFVGHKTEPAGGTWATVAAGWPLQDAGYDDPCFVCVSSVDGNNIIYEFRIKQFDNLYARDGAVNPTVVSQLQVGKVIGFDVIIDDRWGINAADFGVLASNTNTGRSGNADKFTRYTLVEQTPCGAWGYFASDFDGDCLVNFVDVAEFAESWLMCNEPGVTGCIGTW